MWRLPRMPGLQRSYLQQESRAAPVRKASKAAKLRVAVWREPAWQAVRAAHATHWSSRSCKLQQSRFQYGKDPLWRPSVASLVHTSSMLAQRSVESIVYIDICSLHFLAPAFSSVDCSTPSCIQLASCRALMYQTIARMKCYRVLMHSRRHLCVQRRQPR